MAEPSHAPDPGDPPPHPGEFWVRVDGSLRESAHQERRLLTLLELGGEIARQQDEREVCAIGLLTLMGHLGTSRGALWVRDDAEPGVFCVAASHGVPERLRAGLGPGLARLATRVATGEAPAVADHAGLEAAVDDLTHAHLREAGLDALGALANAGEVLGFVGVGRPAAAGATWRVDREVFGAGCGMLAVALSNARLIGRLQARTEELAHANRDLAELDRMKSEFLQTINHELRTPLAVILGASSCLRTGATGKEGPERFHEMISVQAARLHEMIQSLLDFGSLTSRTLDVARHPVRIHELVRAYHASRAPKVERSGRRLEHAPDGRPIVAVGDARRVAEILERLVDNATRFTPIGTRIVLRECLEAGEDRAWAVVEVEDDGPGIAPEHLDRIFRPFAQVDGSATRTIGGLGLGLAAARAFAEAMGGALEATSVPGRGATFRLRLPSA